MSVTRISIVVPVYNEHDTIPACLRALTAALQNHDHEILVCHDREDDTTLGAVRTMPDAPPTVRFVHNALGPGPAFAMRSGFKAATGDVIVAVMADLCDPPEHIVPMVEKIRRGEADIVGGARYAPGGRYQGAPPLKQFLSKAAGRTLRWLTGISTHDATTNFRAYRRTTVEELAPESRTGFEIALELTVKAHLQGYRVGEIPSRWTERSAGRSRFRMWAWIPSYLRWYMRAAAAPIAVVGAAIAAIATVLPSAILHGGANAAAAAFCAILAIAALFHARSVRGRTAMADALLAPLTMSPFLRLPSPDPAATCLLATTLLALHGFLIRRTEQREPRPTEPAPSRAENALMTLAGMAFWAAALHLPTPRCSPQLDPSWRHAFSYFFGGRLRAGTDYIATYGPLGWLFEAVYDRALFPIMTSWAAILALAVALLAVRLVQELHGLLPRFLFAVTLITALPASPDGLHFLALLLAARAAVARRTPSTSAVLAFASFASAVALIKFTFLPIAGLAFLPLLIRLWQERSKGVALAALGISGSVFLLVWEACGQAVSGLSSYLSGSMEIVRSYGEAMSLSGPQFESTLGFVGLATSGTYVLWAGLKKPRTPTALAFGIITAASCILAWKSGFVRHDFVHVPAFFSVAAVLPFLASPRPPIVAKWLWVRLLPHLAAFPALLGLFAVDQAPTAPLSTEWFDHRASNVASLAAFFQTRDEHERLESAMRKMYDLPQVRKAVGPSTIDIYSPDSEILMLNGLRWISRPVLGPYSTWTSRLMRVNSEFLRREDAPEFFLMNPMPIDGRLTASEDAEALLVILRDYEFVLEENKWTLLRRSARRAAPPVALRPLSEVRLKFGERMEMPAPDPRPRALRARLTFSGSGTLQKTAYKAPPIRLRIWFREGGQALYRVTPGMISEGVLLDPLLQTREDFARWFEGKPGRSPAAIEFVVAPEDRRFFSTEIEVSLTEPDLRRP